MIWRLPSATMAVDARLQRRIHGFEPLLHRRRHRCRSGSAAPRCRTTGGGQRTAAPARCLRATATAGRAARGSAPPYRRAAWRAPRWPRALAPGVWPPPPTWRPPARAGGRRCVERQLRAANPVAMQRCRRHSSATSSRRRAGCPTVAARKWRTTSSVAAVSGTARKAVAREGSTGSSLSATRVTSPSVPSAPMNRCLRS